MISAATGRPVELPHVFGSVVRLCAGLLDPFSPIDLS